MEIVVELDRDRDNVVAGDFDPDCIVPWPAPTMIAVVGPGEETRVHETVNGDVKVVVGETEYTLADAEIVSTSGGDHEISNYF